MAGAGRCSSRPTRPRSTGCSARRRRGQPPRHPGAVRLRRHPRAAHDPAGADRAGGVLGPGDRRAGPVGRRPGGPGGGDPLDLRTDGGHRPRPALGPDHRGRRRGPLPRRGRGRGPGAGLPGRAIGTPERVIAGPKHFAGYGAALGGRDYDEVEPLRLRAVERLLPAVPGRPRRRGGQRDDGVHGPQRGAGVGQPLAVHRGAPRAVGLRRVRGQRRQRGAQPGDPRLRRRPCRCGRPRRRRRGRPRDGDDRPGLQPPGRGRGAGSGERGGRRRLRPAGADGQGAAGSVRGPVRRRGPGQRGAGRPGAPRGRPGRRRAVRGAAAQRGRPAAAGFRRARLARGDRAARRLPARHPGSVGLRLRPGRDRDRARRAAEPAGRDHRGPLRPGHPAGAADVRVDVRHVRGQLARRTRRTSTTTPSCSGPSTWPGTATWPSWWSASGSR